jgi:MFS family permease
MTPEKRLTLAVVSAGTAMLLLDVTVVNVALPAIRADLDASFAELQWVIDAYALALAATLLTAGVLADRHGRRALFAGGLAAFTLCSALRGLAPSGVTLDPARALQGAGAAAMFSASLARCWPTSSAGPSAPSRSPSGARSRAGRSRPGRPSAGCWSTRSGGAGVRP